MPTKRVQELPIKMKGTHGWTVYIFDRGYVSVWDENKKLLSMHLEGKGGGTQQGTVEFYKKDGWKLADLP